MKQSYAFALISAVFFWMLISYTLIPVFPFQGPRLLVILPVVTGVVSMSGILLLMFSPGINNSMKYLLIPLLFALSLLLSVGIIGLFTMHGRGGWSGICLEAAADTGMLLLAPSSLPVFASARASAERPVTIILISLAAVVALFACWTISMIPGSLHHFNPTLGFIIFYWVAGMPVIGACYIAFAFWEKDWGESGAVP